MLERGHLGLGGHDIDGGEDSLLGLPAIALVLLLGKSDGFGLHVEIVPGVVQLPISLDGLSDYFDDALAETAR